MASRLTSSHGWIALVAGLVRLRHHKTVNQAIQLLLWEIPTKLFTFLAVVWMIRCLGPENLGISAIVNAAALSVALFIKLGLDIVGARHLATNKHDAKAIIETVQGLRWRLCLGFSVIWMVGFLLFPPAPEARFAWLMGIPVLIVSGLGTAWAMQGLEELPVQGRVVSIGWLVTIVFTALLIRPGAPAGSDLVARTLGLGVTLALAWSFLRRHAHVRYFAPIKWSDVAALVYKARWALGVTLMLAIYSQLDVLLVAYFTGTEQAGYYRAAVTMTSPLVNLVAILMALLYPRLAVWHQGNPTLLWKRQKHLATAAFVAGASVFIVVLVVSRPMVHLFCGAKYGPAVTPFVILFSAKLMMLVHGVFGWGIMATGRDNRYLISTICAAAVSLVGNSLLIPRYGIVAAACVSLAAELTILATAAYFGWREHQAFVANGVPCGNCGST